MLVLCVARSELPTLLVVADVICATMRCTRDLRQTLLLYQVTVSFFALLFVNKSVAVMLHIPILRADPISLLKWLC